MLIVVYINYDKKSHYMIDSVALSGISPIGGLAISQQPANALSNVQKVGVLQTANAITTSQLAGTTSSAQTAVSTNNSNVGSGTDPCLAA